MSGVEVTKSPGTFAGTSITEGTIDDGDISAVAAVDSSKLNFATSGLAAPSAPVGVANKEVTSATNGTDTACANNTQFLTSLFIPVNMTITSISWLIGSVGTTDKVYGVLYDSAGNNLRNTSLTSGGATVGSPATIQTMNLTATYAAVGPGTFFVGISVNGNHATIRTVPAQLQSGIFGGTVTQTHGSVAAVAAPSSFTADTTPYVFLR